MATTVGDVAIRVGADIGPLQRNMRKGGRTLDSFGRQAATTAKRVGAITAAVTAVSAVLATKMVKSTLAAVDAQAKLARQLDGTIDGLRSVQIAGSDAGVEAGVLNKAMEKLTSRLGEAMEGTGEAAKALEMLGLNAKDLADMDIDERMATIADRMEEMGLSAAVAGDALRNLGIRNGEIINLMRQGGDAIRNAKDELRAFGLSISEIDAAKIEKANDAMTRIGFAGEALSTALTVELAPVIESVANEISKQFGEAGADMREGVGGAVDFGVTKFAQLLTGAAGLIGFIEENPDTAKFGVLGYMIFGKKGAALGAAIGATFGIIEENLVNLGLAGPDSINPINQQLEILSAKLENVQAVMTGLDAVGLSDGPAYQNLIDQATTLQVEMSDLRSQIKGDSDAMAEFNEMMGVGGDKVMSLADRMRALADAMVAGLGGDEGVKVPELDEDSVENQLEAWRGYYAARQTIEDEALGTSAHAYKQYYNRRVDAAEDASDAEIAAAKAEATAKEAIRDDMLSNLSTLMEHHTREQFNIGKAAAYAQALIDGYSAVLSSYKAGAAVGGPVLGAAYAATAVAATATQIDRIASASFGGGSKPSAPANTDPGAGAGQETQQTQRNVNLNLSLVGDSFSRQQVIGLGREMVEEINNALDDGAILRVT